MSQEIITLLLSLLIGILAVGAIYGLILLGKRNKELAPILGQVADVLPTVIKVVQTIVTKGNKANPANQVFDVLTRIAESSAMAVEQVYQKSLTDDTIHTMTSAEKLALAQEYFDKLAEATGINPSEIDEKAVTALIETIVFTLDKKPEDSTVILLED